MREQLYQIYRSFPLQLFLLHFRGNLLLLFLWVMLLLFMTGAIGRRLGAQYLFLDPEYLGTVGFWSFFALGLTFGGFLMSWNLTTYLLTAQYFPFLASLSRPFTKFCINNSLLPLSFFLFYTSLIIYFQADYQQVPAARITLYVLGLLLGVITLVLTYALYFQFTNRDISSYPFFSELPPNLSARLTPGHRKVDLDYIKLDQNRIPVRTYLNEYLRPRIVRSVAHYESSLLMNIFRQNHLNALVLQLLTMLILLLLGYLVEYRAFRIPAGASIFIFFSLITALVGAVTYWFNEWRMPIFILMLLVLNFLTALPFFNRENRAYGLDYEQPPVPYAYEQLQDLCLPGQVAADSLATLAILERWKARQPEARPRLVILCVSGGGLRAAVWTTKVVQMADSLLNGRLMHQTVLITGASGGMMGLAYLREVYRRHRLGEPYNPYDPALIDHISRDLLNPIAFTLVSNDMFLPWSRFELGDESYFKDRAYSFEQQLNEHTQGLLDKPLAAYRQPEAEALIPMLYLTPSIVNDGRRMIISPQGVSFMMMPPAGVRRPDAFEVDAVDFGHLFREHEADSLRFLTGLRMNATYPYVLPLVHLPTEPEIGVMDAGFRDNYGILSATRFIQVFRPWIERNTSGVVLVQISSVEKIEEIKPSGGRGMLRSLFDPLGIAGKVLVVQEFEHDTSLGFIYELLGRNRFEIVRFIYRPGEENKLEATISFHLTRQEEEDILRAVHLPENQASLGRLRQLLGPED